MTPRETIEAALRRRLCNADVLARVRKKHPRSTVSLATVNYFRNRLRAKPAGKAIPTEREARKGRGS
jgi:hypothetical protein